MLTDVISLLESARQGSARAVNAMMTAAYWQIGRRIVESEQHGNVRATYGQALLRKLSDDLARRFGRGFSVRNLEYMRLFYLDRPISQTPSAKSLLLPGTSAPTSISQTLSAKSSASPAILFPLPWSHYVRLLSLKDPQARAFYESEALRGGWSIRQLDRQIDSLFYERTLLSKNKSAMLIKGHKKSPRDLLTPEQQIKDPFVLEFLGLKDEYSESELEDALITHLQSFLLELGDDFAFVGRQRRLRIGDQWFRVDLLFFHRQLNCLIVIDLKVGPFTHADAGQMHLYLNYAGEHWMKPGENPPVGLILCAHKDAAVAKYALDNLPNKILAAEYRFKLPDEKTLAREVQNTQRLFQTRNRRPSPGR
ncbi:MAG TPA: PDDEXK nuclease domain-containing protein [Phycisphaerae bacterium]|nr:PDDEXK nuclease domain-containing protein [Phycisphaerae bacterium]